MKRVMERDKNGEAEKKIEPENERQMEYWRASNGERQLDLQKKKSD